MNKFFISGAADISGYSYGPFATGVGTSGYYAGPYSVPTHYQSPTKYRTCSYCKSNCEIAKNCPNCGAADIPEHKSFSRYK